MANSITVAELLIEIGVDASDAEKAQAKLERQLGKTEKAAAGLGKQVDKTEASIERFRETSRKAGDFANKLVTAMTAVGTAVGLVGAKVISVGSEFETLEARLKTATGSAEGARQAFDFVREFAQNTPFQVEEITDAFVKLTNFGIAPTEDTLTALGDTASAFGKSLDQVVEAVADATQGEFERLKEFGIRAKQAGDDVEFTFKGVTTTVGKNAAEIQDFLISLGQDNFAGAMSERMNTLDGIISNVKDSITNFFLEVARDGPLEEFKGLIKDLRDGVGGSDGLAKTLSRTLVNAIRTVRRVISGDFVKVLESAAKALEFFVDNWEIFIGVLAGAKTIQAFSAAAAGLASMGVAAGAALGPIGAIAGALIALVPIANKAGRALGDAIAKRSQLLEGPKAKRGAGRTLGQFTEAERGQLKAKDSEIQKLQAQAEALQARGVSLRSPAGQKILSQRDRLVSERASMEAKFSASATQREGAEAARRAEEDRQRAADEAFAAQQEAELANIPIGPEFVPSAFKAPSGGRRGGSGRKRVTSPTTISEFFRAAAQGDLGPIAARTPSTKDIEPTVAIDITNNNFTFNDTFNVSGADGPEGTARKITEMIRAEFQGRLSSAGQQMATNLVR